MAKKGLDIKTIQPVLRDVTKRNGWSLCVGAGTSVPALADWYTLVELLIKNNCSKNEIIDIDVYRKMDFSPEAMIQAVQNHMHLSDKEFIRLLSDEIYRPIRTALTAQEWDTFVKIRCSTSITCRPATATGCSLTESPTAFMSRSMTEYHIFTATV